MGLREHGLGAKEGVLVHLFQQNKFKEDFTSPKAATQPGISRTLGVQRSYVSYVLSKLIEQGLASERVAHVDGERRKKKVYFLTDEGFQKTRELVDGLKKKPVEVIFKNQVYEKNLEGLRELTGLRILELILATDPRTRSNLDAQDEEVLDVPEPPPLVQALPEVRNFVGREEEMNQCQEWFEQDTGVLTIYGIAGQGKTALVARLLEEWNETDCEFIYHKVKDWSSEISIYTEAALGLKRAARNKLSDLISEKHTITHEQFFYVLKNELKDLKLCLVLDDLEAFPDKVRLKTLLKMFVELGRSDMKLILLSRSKLDLVDPRSSVLSNDVTEIELGGLDRTEVQEYLEKENIQPIEDVFEITSGHPLFLNLYAHFYNVQGPSEARQSIREFITTQVLTGLKKEERDVLDIISLSRAGVNQDMLMNLDSKELYFSPETIWGLRASNLLLDSEKTFFVHGLVRDVCLQLQPGSRKKRIHSILYDYYSEMSEVVARPKPGRPFEDTMNRIHVLKEMLFHNSLSAGYKEQMSLLSELGEEMFAYSETEVLYRISNSVLEHIDRSSCVDEKDVLDLCSVLILNGHCHFLKGEWDHSLKVYKEAWEISKKNGLSNMVGRSHNVIGTVHLIKGEQEQALEHFSKAIDLLKTPVDLSKALSNMAILYWQRGDLVQALDHIDRSLATSRDIGDNVGIARALTNRGIILWEKGDHKSSLASHHEAMEICVMNRFTQTISQICDNIGEVHLSMGDNEKAREFFNKSLEIAAGLGFKYQIGEVKKNLAKIADTPEERTALLEEALKIYSELGAKKEADEIAALLESPGEPVDLN